MASRDELLAIKAELDRLRVRVDAMLKATPMTGDEQDEPIENLKLTRRTVNCLHRAGVDTVGQLTKLSYRDLLRVKNCGKITLEDVCHGLAERSLTLRGEGLHGGRWYP